MYIFLWSSSIFSSLLIFIAKENVRERFIVSFVFFSANNAKSQLLLPNILAVFKMCFEVDFCFSVLMSFLGHLTFLRGAEWRIPYLKVNFNSQTVHVANVSF